MRSAVKGRSGPEAQLHCHLIQDGEIQVVVGDASRDGIGGRQYCGVWSLTSKHWPFNAFGNSYAGLIPGELRGRAPTLAIDSERACALRHEPVESWPVFAEARYEVRAPCYVDHALRVCDARDVRAAGCSFRELTWCSYMNCPETPSLRFLSGGVWRDYLSPRHGVGANVAPSYVDDGELEVWPPRTTESGHPSPFHWDRAVPRFDLPFYYGRIGPMALMFFFDQPRHLRFFCSPTGGGVSLIAGRSCPAWDFEWVIPASEYVVGREYLLRMTMAYKPFVSDEDVCEEYRKVRSELNFELPPVKGYKREKDRL